MKTLSRIVIVMCLMILLFIWCFQPFSDTISIDKIHSINSAEDRLEWSKWDSINRINK